ncbi:hypothetical protein ATANTOWER_005653 [Ataeniobius toweri]|uniref:Secreted protein n=1 Tax=Ataeniobius toweri TaxID=208326 RepID=A0ABU7CFT2_9TELE|nr:hypothetical protein [Ataeniobius toweri]
MCGDFISKASHRNLLLTWMCFHAVCNLAAPTASFLGSGICFYKEFVCGVAVSTQLQDDVMFFEAGPAGLPGLAARHAILII